MLFSFRESLSYFMAYVFAFKAGLFIGSLGKCLNAFSQERTLVFTFRRELSPFRSSLALSDTGQIRKN